MGIVRRTLAQQAYAAIRAEILEGLLAPGEKLVVRPLTERLGLSPTPIKTALTALEREGFLVARPNRGYFVAEVSGEDMREIYELREVIDGIAARKAAQSPTRMDLADQLRDLLAEQRRLIHRGDLAGYSDLDVAFHHLVWEAAANARLLQVADNLLAQVRFGSGSSSRLPDRLPAALDEHTAILAAIAAGNPLEAEAQCRRHVRLAGEAFDRYYGVPPVTAAQTASVAFR